MNIKEAKEEIKHTLQAYHKKDEDGNYVFPRLRQRPILLMGPPGIGKTAIMEQIAAECNVGLVAYTITHHTRQSAIGLPLIKSRNFDGEVMDVTEYTMSEIIASVYDCMEKTGKSEGILFIDEINCVSETLAPTMLQFLQSKTFGSHRVPEGWMIVAAGNPPEYNKSVREFDIVTLDRVRKIDISADCDVWMEYAVKHQVHGAILSYLGLKPENFYLVENTADGKFFVTARGWEDLSEILKSYEEAEVSVTENLVVQYLQKEEIARSFYVYYQLYCKYGTDYGIREILNGELNDEAYQEKVNMACRGGFEERFTVVNLILSYLSYQLNQYIELDRRISELHGELSGIKKCMEKEALIPIMEDFVEKKRHALEIRKKQELLQTGEERRERWILKKVEDYLCGVKESHAVSNEDGFDCVRELFQRDVQKRKENVEKLQRFLANAFGFVEKCYQEGQEMVLLVSGLARNEDAVKFFSIHECVPFLKFSKMLLYTRQENDLLQECANLLNDMETGG